ncbi:hypothetical protein FA10DRAFT_290253 [Acaromyces ingoldii]|uniref:Uncharacterized protein n=1 Tax=Acaromyces ingoldii TaxID=215250 RepID=A0A316YV28_9BASI|nr:hypothetical protein FA10DRAFT_290253 [Acaromyces ingoldii]PWN93101.1 hypothetical protein FA10DRAFT_290253 [Acaromyces ingoldii]
MRLLSRRLRSAGLVLAAALVLFAVVSTTPVTHTTASDHDELERTDINTFPSFDQTQQCVDLALAHNLLDKEDIKEIAAVVSEKLHIPDTDHSDLDKKELEGIVNNLHLDDFKHPKFAFSPGLKDKGKATVNFCRKHLDISSKPKKKNKGKKGLEARPFGQHGQISGSREEDDEPEDDEPEDDEMHESLTGDAPRYSEHHTQGHDSDHRGLQTTHAGPNESQNGKSNDAWSPTSPHQAAPSNLEKRGQHDESDSPNGGLHLQPYERNLQRWNDDRFRQCAALSLQEQILGEEEVDQITAIVSNKIAVSRDQVLKMNEKELEEMIEDDRLNWKASDFSEPLTEKSKEALEHCQSKFDKGSTSNVKKGKGAEGRQQHLPQGQRSNSRGEDAELGDDRPRHSFTEDLSRHATSHSHSNRYGQGDDSDQGALSSGYEKRSPHDESDTRQTSAPSASASLDLSVIATPVIHPASDLDYFKYSDSGTLPYEGNLQPYDRNPQEWNYDRFRQCAALSLREQILGQEEVDQITAVFSDKLGVPPDQFLAMNENELAEKIRDDRLDRKECDFPEPLDEKVTTALKRCQSKFEEGSTSKVKEIEGPGGRRGGPRDQRSNSRGEDAEPEDDQPLHSFTKDPSRDSLSHFYSNKYELGDGVWDQDAPSSSHEKRSLHDESTTRQTSPSAGASFDLLANAASVSQRSASDLDHVGHPYNGALVRRSDEEERLLTTTASFIMLFCFHSFVLVCNLFDPTCTCPFPNAGLQPLERIPQPYERIPQGWKDSWIGQCAALSIRDHVLGEEDAKGFLEVVSKKVKKPADQLMAMDEKTFAKTVKNVRLDEWKATDFPNLLTKKSKEAVEHCQSKFDKGSPSKVTGEKRRRRRRTPHGRLSNSRGGDAEVDDDGPQHSLAKDSSPGSTAHLDSSRYRQGDEDSDQDGPSFSHHEKRSAHDDRDTRQTSPSAGASFDLLANAAPVTRTSASDLKHFDHSDSGALVRRRLNDFERIIVIVATLVLSFCYHSLFFVCNRYMTNCPCPNGGLQPFERNQQPYERIPQGWNDDWYGQCAALSLRDRTLRHEDAQEILEVVSKKVKMPADQLMAMDEKKLAKTVKDVLLDKWEKGDISEPLVGKAKGAVEHCRSTFDEGSTSKVKGEKRRRRRTSHGRLSNSRGEDSEVDDEPHHSLAKDPSPGSTAHLDSSKYGHGDEDSDHDAPSGHEQYEKRSAHDERDTRQTSLSAGASFDLSADAAPVTRTSASDLDRFEHFDSGALVRRFNERHRTILKYATVIVSICLKLLSIIYQTRFGLTKPSPNGGLQPFERIPQGWNDEWSRQCAALSLRDHVLGEEDAKGFLEVVSKKVKKPADQLMAMDEKTFAKTVKDVRLDEWKASDFSGPLTKKSKEAVEHCQSKFDKGSTSKANEKKGMGRRRRRRPHGQHSNPRGKDAEVDDGELRHSLTEDPSPGSVAHLGSSKYGHGDEDSDHDAPSGHEKYEKRSTRDESDTRQPLSSSVGASDLFVSVTPEVQTSASDFEKSDHSHTEVLARRMFDRNTWAVLVVSFLLAMYEQARILDFSLVPLPHRVVPRPPYRSKYGYGNVQFGRQCLKLAREHKIRMNNDIDKIASVCERAGLSIPTDSDLEDNPKLLEAIFDELFSKMYNSDPLSIPEDVKQKGKEISELCEKELDVATSSSSSHEKRLQHGESDITHSPSFSPDARIELIVNTTPVTRTAAKDVEIFDRTDTEILVRRDRWSNLGVFFLFILMAYRSIWPCKEYYPLFPKQSPDRASLPNAACWPADYETNIVKKCLGNTTVQQLVPNEDLDEIERLIKKYGGPELAAKYAQVDSKTLASIAQDLNAQANDQVYKHVNDLVEARPETAKKVFETCRKVIEEGDTPESTRQIVQGPDPRHNGIPHDVWSTTSRSYAPPPSREERSDTRHPPPSSVGATFNYSAYRDRTPSSSMTEPRDRTPSSSMTELQRHGERHEKTPISGPSKKEHVEPPRLHSDDYEDEHSRRNLDSLHSHEHSDRAHTSEETELKRRQERPQERPLSLR